MNLYEVEFEGICPVGNCPLKQTI